MITDSFFLASFHASPIGQYLLAPTDKLEILAVNDAFLRSVGRKRETVLGLPLFEVFPNDPDDPHDTGVQDLERSIWLSVESGMTQKMPTQRYPIEMYRDGRSWFEDMYWSATNTPVYDSEGVLICIAHTTIDITAQVLAEQALNASRQEAVRHAQTAEAERANLEAVLISAPVGILVVDASGSILQRNPAHLSLFGDNLAEQQRRVDLRDWNGWFVDGEKAGHKLDPDDWPLARAMRGHAVNRCVLRVESFDTREIRTMLISSAPILGSRNEILGAVAMSLDIEERVRAEQALKEADRRKDEFLAMLAHELRNPLAPIGTAASLLMHTRRDDEQVQRTSQVITRQVKHMSSLVDDLLDVARVTRGLIKLDKAIVDMKRVLAEALEQARPAIESRQHSLQVNQPPMPAFVMGDSKRLVQVVANLLHNAAKFTPEGGFIRVELAIDPHHVRLSVTDNGQGMSPDLLDRAFDIFTQGDRSLDRTQGGLGIGLALVRSVVALHEGSVNAQSGGHGQGARFTMCLPKVEPESTLHDDRDSPDANRGGRRLSVLVVDDNEDALEMLNLLLSSAGHRVMTASTSRDALSCVDEHRPDVCVLDIGLPEMDGFALARALRAKPHTRDALLIAVSGYGQESNRMTAFEAGFDDYFVKPVSIDALSIAITRQR